MSAQTPHMSTTDMQAHTHHTLTCSFEELHVAPRGQTMCACKTVYVFFAANDAEEVSNEEQQVQQWRLTPEQAGPVRMLQWGGISRSTPQWPSRWGMLYRGTLHLLENETSIEPLDSLNIWNNRWERSKQIQVQCCYTASSVMHAGQVFEPLPFVHVKPFTSSSLCRK